jgi:hypothetical protein
MTMNSFLLLHRSMAVVDLLFTISGMSDALHCHPDDAVVCMWLIYKQLKDSSKLSPLNCSIHSRISPSPVGTEPRHTTTKPKHYVLPTLEPTCFQLTLYLLTWRIWWAPNNASKWQMGFKSAFEGLTNVYKNRKMFRFVIVLQSTAGTYWTDLTAACTLTATVTWYDSLNVFHHLQGPCFNFQCLPTYMYVYITL